MALKKTGQKKMFGGGGGGGSTSKVCPAYPVMTKPPRAIRSLPPLPLAAPPVPPYPGVEPATSSSPAPLASSLMQTPCDGPCQIGTASWEEKQ